MEIRVMTKFIASEKRDDENQTDYLIRCIREETLHDLRTQIIDMDVVGPGSYKRLMTSSGYYGDEFDAYMSGLESTKERIVELINTAMSKNRKAGGNP
jgi:hypothetical protein